MTEERQDKMPAADENQAQDPAAPAPETAEHQVAELRAQVARYKDDAERNWQQFLYAAADLENYKKQAARQRDEAVRRARYALLTTVLRVVDNLDRALEHGGEGDRERIGEGIRMTHRQVMEALANLGVTPIAAKGQPFDPRYHEAVDVTPHESDDVTPGTVIEELQRGYLVNGEVLRPAKVRVAK